jgi:hypothetical protein
MWKEAAELGSVPECAPEVLRKALVDLNKDNRLPGIHLKPGPPDYESGVWSEKIVPFSRYNVYLSPPVIQKVAFRVLIGTITADRFP